MKHDPGEGRAPRPKPRFGGPDLEQPLSGGPARQRARFGGPVQRRRLLIALSLALLATVISGLLYPGGISRREPESQGYSLTRNYFSDLGMTVTYGGHRNLLGSGLFVFTCFGYGYGAWAFALLVIRHGPSGGGGGVIQSSAWRRLVSMGVLSGGALAALGFFLTGLTPKNLLFHLHNWVSYSAFLGLLLLWVAASAYLPSGLPRRVSLVMVAFSAAYLALLYSRPDWKLPANWQLQVVAQKIIVLANWVGLFAAGLGIRRYVSRETDA